MSEHSNLSVVDMNNLHFVLCGAAITIQTAWRRYKLMSSLNTQTSPIQTHQISSNDISKKLVINHEPLTENFNSIVNRYFDTNFQFDVELVVEESEIFLCHSMVLWCNIGYFKEKFPTNTECHAFIKYKFELPKSISKKCWKTIQDYIYGYDIEIDDIHLYNQLAKACITLDIPTLECDLKEHDLKFECDDSNENVNNNNNNNNSDDYEGDEETEDDSSHPPLQLISNYYKFFKCVLSSYLKQKISLQQTHAYLSSTFINYENMNEFELRKCIYLLKTKLKKHNSSRLLFDLIKIFLEN